MFSHCTTCFLLQAETKSSELSHRFTPQSKLGRNFNGIFVHCDYYQFIHLPHYAPVSANAVKILNLHRKRRNGPRTISPCDMHLMSIIIASELLNARNKIRVFCFYLYPEFAHGSIIKSIKSDFSIVTYMC